MLSRCQMFKIALRRCPFDPPCGFVAGVDRHGAVTARGRGRERYRSGTLDLMKRFGLDWRFPWARDVNQ